MSGTQTPLIPVGTKLTEAEFSKFTHFQLTHRTILDPRYAEFEKTFHWDDYIVVNVKDKTFRREIIASLEQFSKTAEGQHVIRQAAAMEAYRRFETLNPTSEQKQKSRVQIMDGYICSFQVNFNELWMNKKSLLKHEYLGADKKYHPFSIQHVLFHELMHAADGLLTKHNKEVQKAHIVNILKSHPNIDYAEYKFSETEIPATSATNRFIAPHYKETLRANYFDVREKLKSSGVVNGSQFFHDHIDLPPAQQLPPKQNTPGHNKR